MLAQPAAARTEQIVKQTRQHTHQTALQTLRTIPAALTSTCPNTDPAGLITSLHRALQTTQLLATLTGHPDLADALSTTTELVGHTATAQQHVQDQTQRRRPNPAIRTLHRIWTHYQNSNSPDQKRPRPS